MRSRALAAGACVLLASLAAPWAPGATPVRAAERADERDSARDARLVETYRQMLAEDPSQEYAFRRLLETAHAVGGLSALIAQYREDVEAYPTRYAAWLVLGNLYRVADDPTRALECYEQAAQLAPRKAAPHLAAAALHRQRREFAEAFAAYERAIPLIAERDARQEALRAAAETAVEARELSRARGYFEKIVQSAPGNLFLRMQEANTLTRLDEPALALEVWQAIEPRAADLGEKVIIWKEKAALELELGRSEAAIATWRKGLAALPSGHFERRAFLDGLVAVYRRTEGLPQLIDELTALAERDVDALLVLAAVHEELAQDELALARYREAERRRPRDEAVRLAVLSLLERLGRTDEVRLAWEGLVKAFPDEPRHALKLAELLFIGARPEEAQALLRQTSRRHPNDPGVHVQLIDLWVRHGDKTARKEIEGEYRTLMRLEPDEPAHVVGLGEYHWSLEDRALALETWQMLEKMGTKPGEGSFLHGEVLLDHDLFVEALAALEVARAKLPDEPRVLRALAILHEKAGRSAEAGALWQRLVELTPGRGAREARERLIDLWERNRRVEAELGALARRFDAEPPDLGAGRLLALAQLRLGRLEEARLVLERLERIDPEEVETLLGLSQVHVRLGLTERAIEDFERLARLVPRAASEYLHRAAELVLGAGERERASRLIRQIVEVAPGDANALARVGELYLRMGLRAEAAESWREVLVLEPRNIDVRFRLAGLYRESGDEVRESQLLETIVRDTSDGSELLRAGRRLLQLAVIRDRLGALEEAIRPLMAGARQGPQRAARLRFIVEVIGRLAREIEVHGAGGETHAALERLGERALSPLVEALEDADLTLRDEALAVLALTHPPGAVPALARLARSADAADVAGRVQAIIGLGRSGTAGAAAVLGKLEGGARELGLWALGLSGRSEALEMLTERARSGTPRDRALIAAALGHGRPQGGGPLALELARDRAPDAREFGLWALGRLGFEGAIAELEARLSAGSREGRIAAASLARIGSPEARAALGRALFRSVTHGVAEPIWAGLTSGPLNEEVAVNAGYFSLVDAARGALAPGRPSFHLSERLTQFHPDELAPGSPLGALIAERIAATLAQGPREAASVARWLTTGGTLGLFAVPKEAETAMEEVTATLLGPHIDRIIRAMRAPEPNAAWLEVWARWLRGHGVTLSPEAVAALLSAAQEALLGDDDRAAVAALEVLAAPALGPHLASLSPDLGRMLGRLAGHPRRAVRAALAEVAVAVGDLDALGALLDDVDPLVIAAAAEALARAPFAVPSPLIERLVEHAQAPIELVAHAAVDALGALGQPGRLLALRPRAGAALAGRIDGWLARPSPGPTLPGPLPKSPR